MKTINQNLEPKYQTCFETIIDRIDNEKKSFTNRELLEICRRVADIFSGKANPHFCHEIGEAALNLLIRRKNAENFLASENPAEVTIHWLKTIISR